MTVCIRILCELCRAICLFAHKRRPTLSHQYQCAALVVCTDMCECMTVDTIRTGSRLLVLQINQLCAVVTQVFRLYVYVRAPVYLFACMYCVCMCWCMRVRFILFHFFCNSLKSFFLFMLKLWMNAFSFTVYIYT